MDFVAVLIGVVMVAALVGMIICSKKQKVNPNAQPLAIGLLIVVIICGVAMMYRTGVFGGSNEARREQENKFTSSQGVILGQYLAKNCPGKVLVLAEPDYKTSTYTKMLVDGLKEGLGAGADVVVDTVTIPGQKAANPEMPEMMPLMDTMTAKDFDAAVDSHPDCKVIVSMIGLPRDMARMKLWKQKDAPKVALFSAYGNLKALIARGMVVAVTMAKPKADYESSYPGDAQEAFDMRYVLVTTQNIESVLGKYKNLFGR